MESSENDMNGPQEDEGSSGEAFSSRKRRSEVSFNVYMSGKSRKAYKTSADIDTSQNSKALHQFCLQQYATGVLIFSCLHKKHVKWFEEAG